MPVDESDGAGMNLMDIGQRKWAPQLADFVHPDLRRVLPEPVPSWTRLGPVAPSRRWWAV